MVIFEVSINGEVRCRAGVEETGTVSADLSYLPVTIPLLANSVAAGKVPPVVPILRITGTQGTDTEDKEFLDWLDERCEVGTEITLRIVEAEAASVTPEKSPDPQEERMQRAVRRAYYQILKAEFGNAKNE